VHISASETCESRTLVSVDNSPCIKLKTLISPRGLAGRFEPTAAYGVGFSARREKLGRRYGPPWEDPTFGQIFDARVQTSQHQARVHGGPNRRPSERSSGRRRRLAVPPPAPNPSVRGRRRSDHAARQVGNSQWIRNEESATRKLAYIPGLPGFWHLRPFERC